MIWTALPCHGQAHPRCLGARLPSASCYTPRTLSAHTCGSGATIACTLPPPAPPVPPPRASYVLESEANFAAAESDSFAAGYLAELEATLNTLRPHLAAQVLDQLLQLLVKASCLPPLPCPTPASVTCPLLARPLSGGDGEKGQHGDAPQGA